MGKKVNPIGFRIGIYRSWDVRWFPRGSDTYAQMAHEDNSIRAFISKHLDAAEVERVEIERTGENVKVIVHTARPGVVIGKKGQEIETIRRQLAAHLKRDTVEISVQEVKIPELSAMIVAKNIADQIEKRASYKKLMKKAATTALRSGAKGIKIRVAGRLGGAEIARDEWLRVGQTPLHTLRSDIDYALAEAMTKYGIIGIKVWICRGEYKLTPPAATVAQAA